MVTVFAYVNHVPVDILVEYLEAVHVVYRRHAEYIIPYNYRRMESPTCSDLDKFYALNITHQRYQYVSGTYSSFITALWGRHFFHTF